MFRTLYIFYILSFFLRIYCESPADWLYVFAYSWTPEFCYGKSYTGCSSPEDYWNTHFTIHGLWPQYSDKNGYPSYCTSEPFNATLIETNIGMDTLEKYWPNVQGNPTDTNYSSFWEHEWSKHGTCTGLTQLAYFENAIELAEKYGTPNYIDESIGASISADILRTQMGGETQVSLQCVNGEYLSGAYTCWIQENGIPQYMTPCPLSVIEEDTCYEDILFITSFST